MRNGNTIALETMSHWIGLYRLMKFGFLRSAT